MKVTIDSEVLKELAYMVELHKQHGAPNTFDNVPDLVGYVLASVADGSRRPGAWERSMLDMMGLVADGPEHQQYRSTYGRPSPPPTRKPTPDELAGMAWWNAMPEADRENWLKLADLMTGKIGGTASVADAWAIHKEHGSLNESSAAYFASRQKLLPPET